MPPRALLLRGVAFAAIVACAACAEPAADAASSVVTAPPPPAPSPPADAPAAAAPPGPPAPAAPHRPSVKELRAEVERDPSRFVGRDVSLEVVYVGLSQRKYGHAGNRSIEHPGGVVPVVHVALDGAPDDTLECQMPSHTWPPVGLKPGDALTVKGVWSFDRLWSGGTREGGGPLHIARCVVSRRVAGDD